MELPATSESTVTAEDAKVGTRPNQEANDTFVGREYPDERFVSDTVRLQAANKHTKGLAIPENVKVAESRFPINSEQRKSCGRSFDRPEYWQWREIPCTSRQNQERTKPASQMPWSTEFPLNSGTSPDSQEKSKSGSRTPRRKGMASTFF